MKIIKCDLCKKEIESEPITILGLTPLSKIELCQECAKPVIKFLKEEQLIEEEEKEKHN